MLCVLKKYQKPRKRMNRKFKTYLDSEITDSIVLILTLIKKIKNSIKFTRLSYKL